MQQDVMAVRRSSHHARADSETQYHVGRPYAYLTMPGIFCCDIVIASNPLVSSHHTKSDDTNITIFIGGINTDKLLAGLYRYHYRSELRGYSAVSSLPLSSGLPIE